MEQNTTFSAVAALWKADKKQYVKKSTYAAYCLLIQSHLLPELGEREDVQEKDVQDLVNRKTGLRPQSEDGPGYSGGSQDDSPLWDQTRLVARSPD